MIISNPNEKIRLEDLDPSTFKVLGERETRMRLLMHAKLAGCLNEMKALFNKYDNLLKHCRNEKEKKDISKLGCYEMYRLLGGGGELYIDGELVAKDD